MKNVTPNQTTTTTQPTAPAARGPHRARPYCAALRSLIPAGSAPKTDAGKLKQALAIVSRAVYTALPAKQKKQRLTVTFEGANTPQAHAARPFTSVYVDPAIVLSPRDGYTLLHTVDVLIGDVLLKAAVKANCSPDVMQQDALRYSDQIQSLYRAAERHAAESAVQESQPGFCCYLDARAWYYDKPSQAQALAQAAAAAPLDSDLDHTDLFVSLMRHALTNRGQSPINYGRWDDTIQKACGLLASCTQSRERLRTCVELINAFTPPPPPPPAPEPEPEQETEPETEEQEQPSSESEPEDTDEDQGADDEQDEDTEDQDSLGETEKGTNEDTAEDEDGAEDQEQDEEPDDDGSDNAPVGDGAQDEETDEETDDEASEQDDQSEGDADGTPEESAEDQDTEQDGDPTDSDNAAAAAELDESAEEEDSAAEPCAVDVDESDIPEDDDSDVLQVDDPSALALAPPPAFDASKPQVEVSLAIAPDATPAPEDADTARQPWLSAPGNLIDHKARNMAPAQEAVQSPATKAVYQSTVRTLAPFIRALKSKVAFVGDERSEYESGFRSGDLDEGALTELFGDDPHPAVFARRDIIKRPAVGITLLIDCSGSMRTRNRIEDAKAVCTMLAESFAGIDGVDISILGYTTVKGSDTTPLLIHIVTPDRPYSAGNAAAITLLSPSEYTPTHYCLSATAQHMAQWYKEPEYVKRFMFVISDGLPQMASIEGRSVDGGAYTRFQVDRARTVHGVECIGIGIAGAYDQAKSDEMFGTGRGIVLKDVATAAPIIGAYLTRELRKIM